MPITPELAGQARQDIFVFIERTFEIAHVLIKDPPRHKEVMLIHADMVEPLRKAWDEFQRDFDLRAAYKLIAAVPDYKLQSYGLYGAQANAKLQLFYMRLAMFEEDITKKNLAGLLDAMGVCLDSVAQAAELGGALRELQMLLRHSVAD